MAEKCRFWPKPAILFPVNNFTRHNIIKKPSTLLFGFLGVWVMTLCTLLLICSNFNKHIYYLTIYSSNTCQITQTGQQKARFSRKSETKVPDKVIIF